MKKNHLILAFLTACAGIAKAAGPSPAYWQGTWAKILSSAGLDITGTGQGLKGVTDGSNATTGNVGEYVACTPGVVTASATGVNQNLCSIALTAGDWDVTGNATLATGTTTTTPTGVQVMCVTTGGSASFSGCSTNYNEVDTYTGWFTVAGNGSAIYVGLVPRYRVVVSSSQTVWLNAQANYSNNAPGWRYGMSARRMR